MLLILWLIFQTVHTGFHLYMICGSVDVTSVTNLLVKANKKEDKLCDESIMSTPLGSGHIIVAFSAVRRP